MAIEHPEPTPATAKHLYAHAFGCAHEGCRRPLYKVDEVTSERILNSRICHIHARREGGPRWEPSQSAEENRSHENLVLMCTEHASDIDNPSLTERYPAGLLQTWKAIQIQDYDKLRQGWILDDAMAQTAIEASSSASAIHIVDSNVSLGGAGGAAPGAGGGGGGAIGPNARGGRGGYGGGSRVDEEDFTIPIPSIKGGLLHDPGTDLDRGRSPGAGGGGTGAVGDDAVGGDGGGGGERVTSFIDLQQLREHGFDHAEIVIGEGGRGGSAAGEHGSDGGDTTIRFVTTDGTVLKQIVAAGGSGGSSGGTSLPDDVTELAPSDIEFGFRVTTFMPVNAVEFRDGLIFTLGAGWSRFEVDRLPRSANWIIVGTARWRRLRAGRFGMFLSIHDPTELEVARVSVVIPTENNKDGCLHWFQVIGATLDTEGVWVVRISASGQVLAEYDVRVVQI